MKYLSLCAVVVATCIVPISQSTLASPFDSKGLYVSSSIGITSVSDVQLYTDDDGYDDEIVTSDVNDSGVSFMLVGGYQFFQGVSVELGYLNLGEVGFEENVKYLDGADKVKHESDDEFVFKPSGIITGVNYALPVSDAFSIKGRLGLFVWNLDVDREILYQDNYYTIIEPDSDSYSDDGSSVYYGLGVGFDITNRIELFADWSRYSVSHDDWKSDHDNDVFEVGLTYYFGGNQARSKAGKPQQSASAQSGYQQQPMSRRVESSEQEESDQRKNKKSSGEALACDEKYKHLFGICQ